MSGGSQGLRPPPAPFGADDAVEHSLQHVPPAPTRRGVERPWFARLAPASPTYATQAVEEAFNWAECARDADAGEWYVVAFRSVRRETADDDRLEEYDRRALREARRYPGFVQYFKGHPTARRECLSFCIWETRDQARAAARGRAHGEAVGLVREMYEVYTLEFWRLIKRDRLTAFEFEPLGRTDPG